MLIVSVIAGPIGVGKTSVMRALAAECMDDASTIFIEEDIEQWQYYLEKFYNDPAQYAFWFQKEIEGHFHRVTKRLQQLEERSEKEQRRYHVVVERSPLEALKVFLRLSTALSVDDVACLKHSLWRYAEHPVWKKAQYLFIECPEHECLARIGRRARGGEEHIDQEYIQKVIEQYQALIPHVNNATRLSNTGTLHDCVQQALHVLRLKAT